MGCDERCDIPKKYLVKDSGPKIDTTRFPSEHTGQLQSPLLPVHTYTSLRSDLPYSVGQVEEKAQEPLQHTRPPLTLFESDLRQLLSKHRMENMSGTPDFILAEYLHAGLDAFSVAMRRRKEWYGRKVFGQ